MKTIAIVSFDQFTDIDVFLPWDLFNRLKQVEENWQVKIVGTKDSHLSVNGIELKVHDSIESCSKADIVFFSSGPGTRKLYKDEQYLKRFQLDPQKQVIVSMCSGALILAALGLLNGIPATTYPTAVTALKELGINVIEDQHLVTHENIGTAAGCLAAIDLVSWCIDKTAGQKAREKVIASVLPVGQGQVCLY